MPLFTSVALLLIGSAALVSQGADAYPNSHQCSSAGTWNGGASFNRMGVGSYTTSPGDACKFSTPDGTDITCGGSVAVTLSTDNGGGYGLKVAVLDGATVSDTAASPNTNVHTSSVPNTCRGTSDRESEAELSIDTGTILTNGVVNLVGLCGGNNDVMYVVKQTFNVVGCTDAPTNSPTKSPSKAPTNTPSNSPSGPPGSPTKNPTKSPSVTQPTKSPAENPTSAPTEASAAISVSFGVGAFIACLSAVATSLV